ncbi:MAG: phosphoribosylamine--glycine ligase, partial [Chitinophagia bacterium]|nr:phosphoribosylamine--glycine ligase [Chitinophagia bacterium]
MRTYNVLILGSGGRESALAWKIKQSPLCGKLYIAPGNGGTLSYGENIAISYTDFQAIKEKCISLSIAIVVVGSEEPLVKGIYNFFKADSQLSSILMVAPSAEGAQLE